MPRLTFRDVVEADLAVLSGWLAAPHVHRYWHEPHDLASVRARYQPCLDGRDPTYLAILSVDGIDVGLVQSYRLADEADWTATLAAAGIEGLDRAAGIDYLIGDLDYVNRGIGTQAIREFSADTFHRYADTDRLIVTVSQDNPASWHALEKAGYARIWSGELNTDDPSDAGPQFGYQRLRTELSDEITV